jgi:hypothetical protein
MSARALRNGWMAVLVWALLLGTLAAVLWIWTAKAVPVLLLGGAAAATAVVAVVTALASKHAGSPADERRAGEFSIPIVLVAAGLAGLVVGAQAGTWLVWAGGGVFLFGLALVAREVGVSK